MTRRSLAALPLSLAAATPVPLVVVACKSDHTVALVNAATLAVEARIPTGEGPHEVCVIGAMAYAGIYGVGGRPGHHLAVIDLAAQREVRRIDLRPLRSPHGLIPVGGKIYFTAEQARAVGRIDPAADRAEWSMGTGQYGTHMLVATPDGRKLYTTNVFENTVSAIEVMPSKPGPPRLAQIRVGERPEGIAITPNGKEVWAGHNTDGQISIIDTATDTVKQVIPASRMAFRLAFTSDGKTCVVAGGTGNELVLIDTASRAVRQRIATAGAVPQGILISPDDRWLFVATGRALLRFELATGQPSGSCEPGAGVDGLAWATGSA